MSGSKIINTKKYKLLKGTKFSTFSKETLNSKINKYYFVYEVSSKFVRSFVHSFFKFYFLSFYVLKF